MGNTDIGVIGAPLSTGASSGRARQYALMDWLLLNESAREPWCLRALFVEVVMANCPAWVHPITSKAVPLFGFVSSRLIHESVNRIESHVGRPGYVPLRRGG